MLIAVKFGVADTQEIPDTQAERVREYMRGEMISKLKESGLI